MTKLKVSIFGLSLLAISFILYSCNKDDDSTTVTPTTGAVSILSTVQTKYKSMVTISTSGTSITLKSNGLPDHKTPYWGVGNALYEDFPAGHAPNVNTSMTAQNYVMTIPTNPSVATSHEATVLGAIGMALNGVAIYNDREGGNIPLDAQTLTTLDYSGAHPAPGMVYHYHTTGRYVSENDSNLIGFLRDGFPIYGQKDADGTYPANLDAYGGHTGVTTDFSDGIYHYHASNVNYLNSGYYVLKAGSYYGTKGTFTQ
mgnify:CR=1 FL=1|jgi:hypothetical protein